MADKHDTAGAAIERIQSNVLDHLDWGYVECNEDLGEPDLQVDARELLAEIARLRAALHAARAVVDLHMRPGNCRREIIENQQTYAAYLVSLGELW